MNRSLKLSLMLALALGSSQAAALELGQIQVKSALGQPLVAEIPVTPEGAGDLRNLSAKLASDADFMRAGITDGRTSVPLSFAIVNGPHGTKLIRITSAEAINDPYLDLLVEVDNASGTSLREYTILLDPPGMASAPPAAAPAPARKAPSRAPASAPAPQVAANGQIGPVQSGDTLSAIAAKVRPDGVDLNQMLLALKQSNPDAFYRDNINALKRGAVLRVPSTEEARATSIAAAMAEVRRQNSDWRAGTVSAPTNVADAGTRSSASSSPTAPATKASDHLELLPSAKGSKSASAGGGKAADLRRDLQQSQESVANLQQQSADLRSRLKDLEDINGKNQRLLALKDSEIAELQRKLAEARNGAPASEPVAAPAPAPMSAPASMASVAKPAPATAPLQPASASTAPAGNVAPVPASTAGAPASAASVPSGAKPQASEPVVKPVTKPAAKTVPAKVAPRPMATEEPWYMQTWAWGAGGGVVVLLLLLLLRGRRSKAPAKSTSSLADRFGSVPPLDDSGSSDPDQDELLDQLAEHPDDISLHLELVSLYYHRRDVEHFEAAAEAMYAHISDPQQSEWQDVAAMGEDLVPGHPLFAGVDTSVPESERAPLGGFNLDEPAEDLREGAPVPPPMPSGPSKISEYHFDFNLTPRPGAPGDAGQHEEPVEQAEEHPLGAMDDSLSLDSLASEPAAAPAGEADELPAWQPSEGGGDFEMGEFSDDPIDTKLDLARAYLDMGDADGARAMLEEVLAEGTQMQRDTARRLLDGIA